MRYKLLLAYRGTRYHGWQQQAVLPTYKGPRPPPGMGIPTVQELLARAMGYIVGHPVTVVGSSRTDAGVHAKGQIAHFDSPTTIPTENLRRAVNHRLPPDIVIRDIEPVPDSFDAISWAICKRYQYFVWNGRDRSPFFHDLCWHRWQKLDVAAMQAAAAEFVGEHDFTSFCRPGHDRYTTVRDIASCRISSRGPMLVMGIEGAGFLWNMVRIIAGTIVEVGLGRYTPEDMPRMLAAVDRRAAGSTAPPEGLFLQWVKVDLPSSNPPSQGELQL
jgi:tRNA pseudouridine38-40 synthase